MLGWDSPRSETDWSSIRPTSEDTCRACGTEVKNAFVQNRMILRFDSTSICSSKDPARHARNAAQYLKDAFDFFGTEDLQTPVGSCAASSSSTATFN